MRDYTIIFLSLCVLHLCTLCEGRPLRKRTVSEVQLMHNLGEHRQVKERREWLQMRLAGVLTAAARGGGGGGSGSGGGEAGSRARRRPRPGELLQPTPEEGQSARSLLGKLLDSHRS